MWDLSCLTPFRQTYLVSELFSFGFFVVVFTGPEKLCCHC